jgi:F420H(2)-dependent quinone reductase
MSHRRPVSIWAASHMANPVLRPLLRSPAGRRLATRLALIRYRGRRTGRVYELPVQFARDGSRVWVLPGSAEHKTWWRNMRDGIDVGLLLAGRWFHGRAAVVGQRRQPEFAEGLAAYLRAVPKPDEPSHRLRASRYVPPGQRRGRPALAPCWCVSTSRNEPPAGCCTPCCLAARVRSIRPVRAVSAVRHSS